MKRISTITKNLSYVENMRSPRTNNPVANQFKIFTPDGVVFQSYSTIIAIRTNDDRIILDKDKWDYSVTTSKYRNEFLGLNTKEIRELIESGSIKLANLN